MITSRKLKKRLATIDTHDREALEKATRLLEIVIVPYYPLRIACQSLPIGRRTPYGSDRSGSARGPIGWGAAKRRPIASGRRLRTSKLRGSLGGRCSVDREPTTPRRETEEALEEASKHHLQRWPAFLALLAIVVAYSQISGNLAPLPRFAIPAIVTVGILLITLAITRERQ